MKSDRNVLTCLTCHTGLSSLLLPCCFLCLSYHHWISLDPAQLAGFPGVGAGGGAGADDKCEFTMPELDAAIQERFLHGMDDTDATKEIKVRPPHIGSGRGGAGGRRGRGGQGGAS